MKKKHIIFLILIYILFSLSSVFMKYASSAEKIFYKLVFFACSILVLGLFSLLWQIILKKIELSKAYMFKSTTLVWSLFYGAILFGETITINKVIGIVIAMVGIIIIIKGENKNE